jgi:hypothetical protein
VQKRGNLNGLIRRRSRSPFRKDRRRCGEESFCHCGAAAVGEVAVVEEVTEVLRNERVEVHEADVRARCNSRCMSFIARR